jgi:hypothetical protein
MVRTGFSSQGVDLEAQPEDSGHGMLVFSLFSESLPSSSIQIQGGGSVRETDERAPAQEGESLGAAGGIQPKGGVEGEDQAGPPNSQVQNQEEGSTDSGEYDTTLQ